MIEPIPPARILAHWKKYAGLFGKFPDARQILAQVIAGHLWLWDIPGGAMVGKIRNDSGTRFLRINYVAGKAKLWRDARDILASIEKRARKEGIKEIRFCGRRGFIRLFPDYRVVPMVDGIEYRKAL